MTKRHLDMIKAVEFSNNNSKLLHKNELEDGFTYFGIYEKAHPNWMGWFIIKRYLKNIPNIRACSSVLANVSDLNELVIKFYKDEFFDRLKLDLVNSERKQLEVLCFAMNVGIKPAVKVIQKLLGVKQDGIIGIITIAHLNAYNEELFDKLFDEKEIEFYEDLVINKPRFKRYINGWINRANYI